MWSFSYRRLLKVCGFWHSYQHYSEVPATLLGVEAIPMVPALAHLLPPPFLPPLLPHIFSSIWELIGLFSPPPFCFVFAYLLPEIEPRVSCTL